MHIFYLDRDVGTGSEIRDLPSVIRGKEIEILTVKNVHEGSNIGVLSPDKSDPLYMPPRNEGVIPILL